MYGQKKLYYWVKIATFIGKSQFCPIYIVNRLSNRSSSEFPWLFSHLVNTGLKFKALSWSGELNLLRKATGIQS